MMNTPALSRNSAAGQSVKSCGGPSVTRPQPNLGSDASDGACGLPLACPGKPVGARAESSFLDLRWTPDELPHPPPPVGWPFTRHTVVRRARQGCHAASATVWPSQPTRLGQPASDWCAPAREMQSEMRCMRAKICAGALLIPTPRPLLTMFCKSSPPACYRGHGHGHAHGRRHGPAHRCLPTLHSSHTPQPVSAAPRRPQGFVLPCLPFAHCFFFFGDPRASAVRTRTRTRTRRGGSAQPSPLVGFRRPASTRASLGPA
ncbi:hypothetical protein BS50DRAFT_371069 [Corynespora cassiicola Philippines]|uniref:Uncharacterized protein n=1 Tax=Corynespora cassiicola Philippines TaxID=1448308 RepID=A0A2T2NML2_CORCC|nr:hypothetical protein BS50DRAFT_371069 [Corynespora cassiicola Philippines]